MNSVKVNIVGAQCATSRVHEFVLEEKAKYLYHQLGAFQDQG